MITEATKARIVNVQFLHKAAKRKLFIFNINM